MPDSKRLTSVDRLRAAAEAAGIATATALAERSGLKEARVRHYLNGTRPLTQEAAEALARPLNVQASWLLFGPSGVIVPAPDETPSRNFRLAESPGRPDFQHTVEVRGIAQGGPDGRFYFNGEIVDRVARPQRLAHRMGVYCIRLDGNSMDPVLLDNDLLFIDPNGKAIAGRDVLVELLSEQDGEPDPAFVKRVVALAANYIELKEFKPVERTFRIQRSRIKSIHLVLRNADMY